MIRIRRVYDEAGSDRSFAVLIDGLWPRGLRKREVGLDVWLREVAPTPALRRWFGHEPARWAEFRRRYRRELAGHPGEVRALVEAALAGDLTLLFAARDPEHNNAVVLKEYLDGRLARRRGGRGRG